jgi:hypothetical protein
MSMEEVLNDGTTLSAIQTISTGFLTALGAPGAVTNAKVTSTGVHVLFEKASPVGAVDAEFSSVTDGARIALLNTAGGHGSFTIPAPVVGVFGAAPNEDVVDITGAAAPVIAYFEANAQASGSPLNVFNGGVKVGRHARRRAQHKVA